MDFAYLSPVLTLLEKNEGESDKGQDVPLKTNIFIQKVQNLQH